MKVIRIIGVSLLIILILSFVGFLMWSLLKAEANTRASVLGAATVIVVGIFTHYQTKKREIAARHFSDKRDGYMNFIALLFDMILATKKNGHIDNEELLKRYVPVKKAIIIWGGPKIIEEWNYFETMPNNQTPKQALLRFEKILRAIRVDLGHDDSSLPPGSLVAMILVAEDKSTVLDK